MLAVESRPSLVQSSRRRVTYSSVTVPRASKSGAPMASNSSRIQPAPMPSVSRPRQHVDRREDLRGQHGRSMRHHHDGGHETQARRFRGDQGDLRQLFVPPAAGAAGELSGGGVGIFGRDRGRDHDVVAERRSSRSPSPRRQPRSSSGYPAADRGPAVGALKPISICCILPCIASPASMRHHAAASGWRQARSATTCDPLRAETTDHEGDRSTTRFRRLDSAAGRTDSEAAAVCATRRMDA